MEPVTYLSGLTMVIIGYLWFLYQGREVSYSSVLQHSVSARREALYKARGLDVERWLDLIGERKALRREIGKIAEDYDERVWNARQEERDERQKEVARDDEEDGEGGGRAEKAGRGGGGEGRGGREGGGGQKAATRPPIMTWRTLSMTTSMSVRGSPSTAMRSA